MPVDDDTRLRCNLHHGSPSFVLRLATGVVERVESVPADVGLVMVAGSTVLRNGTVVPSVFVVSSGSGELTANYWLVDGTWLDSTDRADRARLGVPDGDIFPYDWSTAVSLERDAFHQAIPPNRPRLP